MLPALQAVPGAAAAASAASAASGSRQQGQPEAAHQAQQRAQQAQQQQGAERPEPSVEERRRLLAEAAMSRLAGISGKPAQLGSSSPSSQQRQQHQQQQQQRKQQQQQQQRKQQQQQQQRGPEPGGHGGQVLPASQQREQLVQLRQEAQQQGQADGQQSQDVVDLLDSPSDANRVRPSTGPRQSQGNGSGRPVAAGAAGGTDRRREGACLQCPVCGRRWDSGAMSNAELNAHVDECLNASFM